MYENLCHKQPQNLGLICHEPEESIRCEYCGWNPKVAKRRHERTIEKYYKENEK